MRKEENKSVGEKGHGLRFFILAKVHQFKTTKKQLGMLISPKAFFKKIYQIHHIPAETSHFTIFKYCLLACCCNVKGLLKY
jgi:hypothetical protein